MVTFIQADEDKDGRNKRDNFMIKSIDFYKDNKGILWIIWGDNSNNLDEVDKFLERQY